MLVTVCQRCVCIVLLAAVVYSAPAYDPSTVETPVHQELKIKDTESDETPVTEPPSAAYAGDTAGNTAGKSTDEAKADDSSNNKEVVDFQTIDKDDDSKVVNEDVDRLIEQKEIPPLTDKDANQLMLLMSDPETIAEYLAVSGDIVGFLQVLDSLQANGFINSKIAEQLKNEVSSDLDKLLVEESARTEAYPIENENEIYMENQMLAIIKQIMTIPVLTPSEVYQAMLYEGSSDLVASVAGLVYQRIIEREITPEAGVSLVAVIFQLSLPTQYITEDDDSYYDDAFLDYILETMSDEEDNVINDLTETESQSHDGEDFEELPIMNAAGDQIGVEQKVHGTKTLTTKEGNAVGKETKKKKVPTATLR